MHQTATQHTQTSNYADLLIFIRFVGILIFRKHQAALVKLQYTKYLTTVHQT